MTVPIDVSADRQLIGSLLRVADGPDAVTQQPPARLYRVRTQDGREYAVKLVAAAAIENLRTCYQATASRLPPAAVRLPDAAAAGRGALPVLPGLVAVLGSGTYGATGWLIMPWLPGTLAGLLLQAPVTARRTAQVMGDVATGLDALHRAGYLHGDVTPANVAVGGPTGGGVLVDVDSVHPAGVAAPRYTPAFAAFETRRDGIATAASDVYSFAATIIAALVGPDAVNATLPDHLRLLEVTARTSPTARGVDTSALRAATRSNPLQRPASASDLLPALQSSADPGGGRDASPAVDLTQGGWGPPPAGAVATVSTVAPVAAVSAATGPVDGELVAAAAEYFGVLDPRQPTVDRVPLRFSADPEPVVEDETQRPVWRRPAFVVSVVVMLLLVVGVLVYELR